MCFVGFLFSTQKRGLFAMINPEDMVDGIFANGIIVDDTTKCPPTCPPVSPINS
jgi:hypothetical protein